MLGSAIPAVGHSVLVPVKLIPGTWCFFSSSTYRSGTAASVDWCVRYQGYPRT